MKKYFGTDGIRGRSNKAPMDPETAMKVGMAAGHYFKKGTHRHRVVIGKDTRLSGYMIEPALTCGFISMGMDVVLLGPTPTPAVSMITRSLRADLGVMISASHNPFEDNGLKLFDARGNKLSDDVERKLEDIMDGDLQKIRSAPKDLGKAQRLDDAVGRYIEYVKQTFPRRLRLDGLKIVIDCANGAAYKIAPMILWELGAEIIPLAVEPNGTNINENCGSTYPDSICEEVVKYGADIGIALDGDADRLIICDENGKLVDGDQIMAAIAEYWHSKERLTGGGIAATLMSNLGLEKYIKSLGLTMKRANVGDRYVLKMMKEKGMNFGGEQSGHLIFGDYATTGDGTLAALQILAIMVEKQQKASEVLGCFTPYPQLLKNVRFEEKDGDLMSNNKVQEIIKNVENDLEGNGRLLIRKSGTEPLIRVMVEAEDSKKTEASVTSIIDTLEAAKG